RSDLYCYARAYGNIRKRVLPVHRARVTPGLIPKDMKEYLHSGNPETGSSCPFTWILGMRRGHCFYNGLQRFPPGILVHIHDF
ncbi:MAG: hypothetical protein ACFFE8_09020, partial [Candidatus Heimdallarchaeota archaeon]